MSAQACANRLLLSPIPPELMNLTDLEWRIIALRIPFMVIFCLVWYGSQYKICGGCANVPSSLNQIVEMLPRMSSEVQFHPMKLNQLYNEVQINDSWVDDWLNSEFATIVDENNDDAIFINDDIDDDTTNLVSHDTNDDNELQIEECELIEDWNATDANLQLTGIPTSNVLEFENLENEVYTCALDENQIPCYILMDDEFEVLAFPDMLPYGTKGYSTSGYHKIKLSMRKYFQQRLLNVDGCFANNIEYLFCAQYATEIKQIQADSIIALWLKHGKTIDGQVVNAGMLCNSDVLNRLVKNEQAHKFLNNVRGSPAYWKHELYEVLAMLHSLGIPTRSMTLSAADLHLIEMIEAVSIHNHKPVTQNEIHKMSIKEWSEKIKLTLSHLLECSNIKFFLPLHIRQP